MAIRCINLIKRSKEPTKNARLSGPNGPVIRYTNLISGSQRPKSKSADKNHCPPHTKQLVWFSANNKLLAPI